MPDVYMGNDYYDCTNVVVHTFKGIVIVVDLTHFYVIVLSDTNHN